MSERVLAFRPAGRTATAVIQRRCACGSRVESGGECEACRKKRLAIQGKGLPGNGLAHVPSIVHEVLRSPGKALDGQTREQYEARFGHDFRDVRVHDEPRAIDSARSLNAQAYTLGRDIVFAVGRYSPETPAGRALLAHELTHVVQQRSGLRTESSTHSINAFELEAERNARLFVTGRPLSFTQAPLRIAKRDDTGSTVTVHEPTGPTDCKLEHHRAIAPAVVQSLNWLQTTVAALSSFLNAPAGPGNARVREAMKNHFHSTTAETARTLRVRLDLLRSDITRRGDPTNPDPARRATFTVECHDETDRVCEQANAYVPAGTDNTVVFCPTFFNEESAQERSDTIIHEMAHTLLGLSIIDRAYRFDRDFPYLSTAEALDNAESYALFTREVGTGKAFRSTAPTDDIEDCPAGTKELAHKAMAHAQRWNSEANEILHDTGDDELLTNHLGDATEATRTTAAEKFKDMKTRFDSPVRIVCISKNCGARTAFGKEAVNRREAGAGIGAAVGGIAGAIAGGILGGVLGGAAIAVAGALLGGVVLAGLGALIGFGVGAALSSREAINLCPAWAEQADEDDRVESILKAAYEAYGGFSLEDSLRYAALARAIHKKHFALLPPLPFKPLDDSNR